MEAATPDLGANSESPCPHPNMLCDCKQVPSALWVPGTSFAGRGNQATCLLTEECCTGPGEMICHQMPCRGTILSLPASGSRFFVALTASLLSPWLPVCFPNCRPASWSHRIQPRTVVILQGKKHCLLPDILDQRE